MFDFYDALLSGYIDERELLESRYPLNHSHSSILTHFIRDDEEELSAVSLKLDEEVARALAPFITAHRWEIARRLAEKYHAFSSLLQICQSSGQLQRIPEYLSTYRNYGFCDALFTWYLEAGTSFPSHMLRRGSHRFLGRFEELLGVPQEYWSELSTFLDDHPQVAWLHDIQVLLLSLLLGPHFQIGNFSRAAQELQGLALGENSKVGRRIELLSLQNLATYAAGNEGAFHPSRSLLIIILDSSQSLALLELARLQQMFVDKAVIREIAPLRY